MSDVETEPMPFGDRREHRKFLRFDPTVSSGSIATIVSLLVTMLIAYGRYEADRARTDAAIEALRATALAEKLVAKESITELKQDVRKVQETITSVDKTVTGIKAEIDAKKGKP